jgi:hypothetical protein
MLVPDSWMFVLNNFGEEDNLLHSATKQSFQGCADLVIRECLLHDDGRDGFPLPTE